MFLNRGLAFQAKCWPKANIVVTKLKQIHRQGEDKELVEALESLRKGKMTKQLDKIVRECGRKLPEIVDVSHHAGKLHQRAGRWQCRRTGRLHQHAGRLHFSCG